MPGCVQGGDTSDSDSPVQDGDLPVVAPPDAGRLPPGGPGASGRVVDAAGRPLAQVFIQAMGAGPGDPPVPELAVFSDPQGNWYWPLRPGNFVLTFSLAGRQTVQRAVQVGPGGESVPIDVVMN